MNDHLYICLSVSLLSLRPPTIHPSVRLPECLSVRVNIAFVAHSVFFCQVICMYTRMSCLSVYFICTLLPLYLSVFVNVPESTN